MRLRSCRDGCRQCQQRKDDNETIDGVPAKSAADHDAAIDALKAHSVEELQWMQMWA
jgi:hypothetical protein